jgi:hypothetical protein
LELNAAPGLLELGKRDLHLLFLLGAVDDLPYFVFELVELKL